MKLNRIAIVLFVFIVVISVLISTFVTNIPINIPVSSTTTQTKPTLKDLWEGNADWVLKNKLTLAGTKWPYGYGAGFHIEIVDSIWYLFSRKVNWGYLPDFCKSKMLENETLSLQIRKSTDVGKTWSDPVDIINTAPGTQWECLGTDGDVFYDSSNQTWHYLFQCLSREGKWNGCHVQRQDKDPMGVFSETLSNPVIKNGDLLKKICDNSEDDCVKIPGESNRVIFDEGTFKFLDEKIDDYYFVSFHAYDGLNGYRGIAKTKDFNNWIAGDSSQGLPDDVIYDRDDANGWREEWQGGKSIGGGAAGIYKENDYYYMFIESGDVNLVCQDGQNWNWGLLRSKSLTNTKWEQLPEGNPFLYSSKFIERNGKSLPCNPGYLGITRDSTTGKIYLAYNRESVSEKDAGIYIFELVNSTNLLENSNFWKCNSENWSSISPASKRTNLSIYRYPNKSSDSNCYLETNSNDINSFDPGQGIYQDVYIGDMQIKRVAFGGKVAMDSSKGKGSIVLYELDKSMTVLKEHKLPISNINTTYRQFKKNLDISSDTTYLRYQFYIESTGTFKLDETFINIVNKDTATFLGMNGNLLSNLDDTKDCTSLGGWQKYPVAATSRTNLSVLNNISQSYSNDCYIAINCGEYCESGQGIFVDINNINRTSESNSLVFGGYFGSVGPTSKAELVVYQYDNAGQLLSEDKQMLHVIQQKYKLYKHTISLQPNTISLRYQIYLHSPVTTKLDDLFIRVL